MNTPNGIVGLIHGSKSAAFQRLNAHLIASPQSSPSPAGKAPQIKQDGPRKADAVDTGESESQIQQRLIKWWADWCATKGLPECVLMAFPLQGKRSKANGARMKAEGMRAGTPDLLLAVSGWRGPHGLSPGYHGLWIEMKRPKGKLEDSQRAMQATLTAQGYIAVTCYGFDHAVKDISDYLNGELRP